MFIIIIKKRTSRSIIRLSTGSKLRAKILNKYQIDAKTNTKKNLCQRIISICIKLISTIESSAEFLRTSNAQKNAYQQKINEECQFIFIIWHIHIVQKGRNWKIICNYWNVIIICYLFIWTFIYIGHSENMVGWYDLAAK